MDESYTSVEQRDFQLGLLASHCGPLAQPDTLMGCGLVLGFWLHSKVLTIRSKAILWMVEII